MVKTATKFNLTARLLHWFSALVILWATISGLYIALFNLDADIKRQILEFNVSVTLVFIPLFCWRMVHRIRQGVPSYNKLLSIAEIKTARLAHILLYTLVSIVLVSGVLMIDKDINVFNLLSIPQPIHDREIRGAFKIFHLYSCRLLAIGIVLHVLAVVKHEFSGRRILKRML